MYNNIWKKIKFLAQILFILGAISSIVVGLWVCFGTDTFMAIGLLYIVIGCICSWVMTWLIYGFGELIERVYNIDRKVQSPSTKQNIQKEFVTTKSLEKIVEKEVLTKDNAQGQGIKEVVHQWRCPSCGKMISEEICPFCGKKENA